MGVGSPNLYGVFLGGGQGCVYPLGFLERCLTADSERLLTFCGTKRWVMTAVPPPAQTLEGPRRWVLVW